MSRKPGIPIEGLVPLPPPEEQPPVNVGTPTFSERLMRALELKGLLPNVLKPSISPVIITADMTEPQYRWLSRERMYQGSMSQAAVAANNQIYELIYGAATNDSMAIVDSVRIFNREATNQLWGIYIVGAIAGGAGSSRISVQDGRSDGPANPGAPFTPLPAFPTATLATLQAVQAVPGTAVLYEIPPSSAIEIPGPWILTIGRSGIILRVHSNSVNVASSIVYRWRERAMPTSEAS